MSTTPAMVDQWIPDVISSSFYDRLADPALTLTKLSAYYGDLEGKAGDQFHIPTDTATTPADNLAVNVPATDDTIGASEWVVTIKEAVKSIAWYDRTKVQSSVDVNQLAGKKVGDAVEQRIELDLGAALVAGRNTSKDAAATGLTWDLIASMRAQIPSRLRKRGLHLVSTDAVMQSMFSDPLVKDAAKFGSDEAIRRGEFTAPILGVKMWTVDDTVLPNITVSAVAGPPLIMFAEGMLLYAFQKRPATETERDARARLTRIVGTTLHGEGTLESAGIVARRVTLP